MRALEAEVVDAVWAATEPLLPAPPEHPLGCHRPRVPDRLCSVGAADPVDDRVRRGSTSKRSSTIRSPTRRCGPAATSGSRPGCSSSYAPKRSPRSTGSSGSTSAEVALDGSLHKAPYGGEGTGPNPTDRGKLGWKWSVAVGPSRRPDRLGDRRRQPQRRPHARAHPRRRRRGRAARRHRHDAPRPRLRLPAPCANGSPATASTDARHPTARHQGARARSSRCGSGCAGSSKRPTRGGRTTASCAATPTAAPATDTPRCASPPSS